ncbi:hypothetical protein XCCB100_2327 [Xanthomonas campestris pv. campestris]|uniref:Uncharacterized protein n=1 Tax=Xanthomonas campestris pv. campestris (strain B100) TaxID=509169 RepID=B0RT96_XANCB|nr:hypothetical protein XCCB100_2327 [Xanthomonas campestris pv. campestris]
MSSPGPGIYIARCVPQMDTSVDALFKWRTQPENGDGRGRLQSSSFKRSFARLRRVGMRTASKLEIRRNPAEKPDRPVRGAHFPNCQRQAFSLDRDG